MLGAIRVLGAWLAEESIALSEDIYGVLPFLLTLSVTHINEVHISEVRNINSIHIVCRISLLINLIYTVNQHG